MELLVVRQSFRMIEEATRLAIGVLKSQDLNRDKAQRLIMATAAIKAYFEEDPDVEALADDPPPLVCEGEDGERGESDATD